MADDKAARGSLRVQMLCRQATQRLSMQPTKQGRTVNKTPLLQHACSMLGTHLCVHDMQGSMQLSNIMPATSLAPQKVPAPTCVQNVQ